MVVLKALTPQAPIDLIAPGSPVSERQIKEAIQRVSALGFSPRVLVQSEGAKVGGAKVSEKFSLLKKALTDPDSKAVWCLRGGYGSQKLVPFLSRMTPSFPPKLLIGYSDITALQLFLNQKWKWPVLHFPVVVHLNQIRIRAIKRFQKIVCGKVIKKGSLVCQQFKKLKILNPGFLSKKPSNICASLMGGNMTVIQSLIGTPWAGSFKGKILFLEEVGEAPYRVDRALWHLQNAGAFRGLKALVLGDFLPTRLSEYSLMQDVLHSFSKIIKSFPVIAGVPLGHGSQKEALPFGTKCECVFTSKKTANLLIHSPFLSST